MLTLTIIKVEHEVRSNLFNWEVVSGDFRVVKDIAVSRKDIEVRGWSVA